MARQRSEGGPHLEGASTVSPASSLYPNSIELFRVQLGVTIPGFTLSKTMDNLFPIVFLLVAIGTLAVWRFRSGKYVLLLCGSVLLSSCLSLRLGKNEEPKQSPTRTEVTYVDRDGTGGRR